MHLSEALKHGKKPAYQACVCSGIGGRRPRQPGPPWWCLPPVPPPRAGETQAGVCLLLTWSVSSSSDGSYAPSTPTLLPPRCGKASSLGWREPRHVTRAPLQQVFCPGKGVCANTHTRAFPAAGGAYPAPADSCLRFARDRWEPDLSSLGRGARGRPLRRPSCTPELSIYFTPLL